MKKLAPWYLIIMLIATLGLQACGDDDDGSEANQVGVGSECTATTECPTYDLDGEGGEDPAQMECLQEFSGGYCGVKDCTKHEDCPTGSMCVTHSDGKNYCFLSCSEKEECNEHRSVENQANCSSSVVFVDGSKSGKTCVPPSGN